MREVGPSAGRLTPDLLHQLPCVSGSQPGAGEQHRLAPDQEVVGQEDEANEGGDRLEASAAQVGHPEDVLAGFEEGLDRLPLVKYGRGPKALTAVDGVSFELRAGETLAWWVSRDPANRVMPER